MWRDFTWNHMPCGCRMRSWEDNKAVLLKLYLHLRPKAFIVRIKKMNWILAYYLYSLAQDATPPPPPYDSWGWQTFDNQGPRRLRDSVSQIQKKILYYFIGAGGQWLQNIWCSVGAHESTSHCAVFNVSPLKAAVEWDIFNIGYIPPQSTPRRRQTSTILLVVAQKNVYKAQFF